jgi:hypothetical protein
MLSKVMAIALGTIGDNPAIVPTRDIIVIVNMAIASKSVALTFMAKFKNKPKFGMCCTMKFVREAKPPSEESYDLSFYGGGKAPLHKKIMA